MTENMQSDIDVEEIKETLSTIENLVDIDGPDAEVKKEEPTLSEELSEDTLTDGELAVYLANMERLSFMEVFNIVEKNKGHLAYLEDSKNALDEVEKMNKKIDNALGESIMKANIMEERGFRSSADEFNKSYKTNVNIINKIISTGEEILKSFGTEEEINKTSFSTEQMLSLIKRKKAGLHKNELNYEYRLKRLDILEEAFTNRLDVAYLIGKANSFFKNKSNVKTYRKVLNNEAYKKDLFKRLNKRFTISLLEKVSQYFNTNFVDYVKANYNIDADKIDMVKIEQARLLFFIFINRIVESEARSGKDIYAKILMLNMGDIVMDNFDIEDDNIDYRGSLNFLLDLFYFN